MKKIYLHKYMSVEALKAFITYHTIKLSFGYEANDCFEMLQGDYEPSSINRTEAVDKHGFISLSSRDDSPYMWGNYADHYKGARLDLVFEIEECNQDKRRYKRIDKDEPRYKLLKNINAMEFEGSHIEKCEYENNRIDKVETKLEECTRNIISNKERSWAQEQEYRIIYSIICGDKPSPLLKSSPVNNGIIYTTKDINHCIYNIALGPLCSISNKDVESGIMREPSLRGVRVERLHFNKCEYRVSGDTINSINNEIIAHLCRAHKIDEIEKLVNNNDAKLEYLDNYGSSYLDYAIRCKSKALFDFFCEKQVMKTRLEQQDISEGLIWAAQHDYIEVVEFLMRNYKDNNFLKCKDAYGRNLIMTAAKNSSTNIFNFLLDKLRQYFKNANSESCEDELKNYLNETDSEGRTALMLASLSKNVDIVRALLKNGADANIRDYQNSSAVMFAVSGLQTNEDDDSKGEEILQLLSEGNKELLRAKEFSGMSAIHYAVNMARSKCIAFLTNNGVKPYINLNLFYCGDERVMGQFYSDKIVENIMPDLPGHIRKNKIEISERYTICFLNLYNLIALKRKKHVHKYLSNLLEIYRDKEHLLAICAAKAGNCDFLHSLLDYCADNSSVNKFSDICSKLHDKGGCTALMWCIGKLSDDKEVFNHRIKCLSFLLEHIDPSLIETQDNSGATVLTWAARKGNIEAASLIFKFLRKHQLLFDSFLMHQDYAGMSLLMWAAWKKQLPFIEFILSIAGEKAQELVNLKDSNHMTVLEWAFFASDEGMVKYLMQLEDKPDSKLVCRFGHYNPIVDA